MIARKLGIAALLLLVSGCAATSSGVAGPKIYIVTDLEGASGVYQFSQTREPGPLNDRVKEYLMGDIAAVVRGLRAGGAGEIVILDGHGSGAFVPELMEPGAKYITGKPRPGPLTDLDGRFDGLVMLACHAMKGTEDGVLNHTQSSKSESRYWYNDVESGELAQYGAIAGHYDIPPILVTGDDATCREAREFFGDECVTVSVKKGLSREAAILYPFAETRRALYEGAREAMRVLPRCKAYRITAPVQAKKQRMVFDAASGAGRLETKEGTITDVSRLMSF